MQMTTVGIDMSKNVFQLRGVDAQGTSDSHNAFLGG